MRRIFMFNMISLDGFFAGEDGNIDWHVVDKEFDTFAVEFNTKIYKVDTVLFGRTTYELFEGFWPKAVTAPETSPDDRTIAQLIQDARKIVFSKTLDTVTWKNAELQKDIDPAFIKKLKAEDGGDIVIWGSGTIVSQLTKLGLIDDYVFMINPVILGKGKTMFSDSREVRKLKRVSVKEFSSGNILATYKMH